MKFIHTSDLHIGKKLKEASLEEDQRYILQQIIDIVREEQPDGILIAGDVYDTTSPTIESVAMLDWFLTSLADMGVPVFMISGNHDSPEKLGFGSRLFETNRVFISGTYSGHLDVHTMTVGEETVDVCLLPFIKPVIARRAHPEDKIESYTDAVRSAIAHTDLVEGRKRILVTHQFVVSAGKSPMLSESESVFVGGTEAVDASVFDGFDYVALGHIHKRQSIGRDTILYSGTPLKYSQSEAGDNKSVTVIKIGDKVSIGTRFLVPKRDVRVIRGPLDRLIETGKSDPGREDFIYAELEGDRIDALSRLREVYPNVMSLDICGRMERMEDIECDESVVLNPVDAFAEFYRAKTGEELTESQLRIVRESFEEASE